MLTALEFLYSALEANPFHMYVASTWHKPIEYIARVAVRARLIQLEMYRNDEARRLSCLSYTLLVAA